MKFLKKLLGYKYSSGDGSRHWFKWGEVEKCKNYELSFVVSQPSSDHEEKCGSFSFRIAKVYVNFHLPFIKPFESEESFEEPRWWGIFFYPFSEYGEHISIYRGKKGCFIIDMPWQWDFIDSSNSVPVSDHKFYCKHTDKTVDVEASLQVYFYRWRALKWFKPWTIAVSRVDFDFSEEVGSRCGTWKGGTLGISCPLKKGESVKDKLKELEEKGL